MNKKRTQYLRRYFELQKEITMVSRLRDDTWWGNRVQLFTADYYDKYPDYNHRSVLDCEVVIEFDFDDRKKNLKLINKVKNQFIEEGIEYALWFSGGKSYHLHSLWDFKTINNLSIIKKTIMRHYCPEEKPDYRLADNNHLVRLEYGLHEGKMKNKSLIQLSSNYLTKINTVSDILWNEYTVYKAKLLQRAMNTSINKVIDSEELKILLKSSTIKLAGDGKKRILFVLINILKKNTYNTNGIYEDKTELTKYLFDWYKYSDGYQFDYNKIKSMVDYYWNRDYSRLGINYITELIEELGITMTK